MDAMVKDHEKDLAEFEKEAKNGSDPNVKSFADKTAKTVRGHLEMAKEIDAKLSRTVGVCCCKTARRKRRAVFTGRWLSIAGRGKWLNNAAYPASQR